MTNNVKCPAVKSNCHDCQRRNVERSENCAQCGADLHCRKYCVPGYNRCEDHGGPSPKRNFYGRGTIVSGASSQFPITRLAARYNKMMTDGRVLSNRQAIDVLDTRIVQLLERVDVNDAPDRMKRLVELWNEYTDNLDNGRSAEAHAGRKQIEAEFEKAYHDYMAWEQMFTALDYRRKMVESEVKVLTAIKAIITVEDARNLQAQLLAAVMRVIGDDPHSMKRIQYEFARISGDVSDAVTARYVEDDAGSDGEGGGTEGLGDVDQA